MRVPWGGGGAGEASVEVQGWVVRNPQRASWAVAYIRTKPPEQEVLREAKEARMARERRGAAGPGTRGPVDGLEPWWDSG